jgi:uncharacterized protein YdeI (YjbR/CyaY-like superfamily)
MDPLFVKDGPALARWLAANPDATELWVGLWKGGAFGWPQLVDELLCVGWIDGQRKTIDARRWKIRITPRKPRSHWSQINLRKMESLVAEGRVTERGLAVWRSRDESRTRAYSFEREAAALAPAELRALRRVAEAWAFYEAMPPGRKRVVNHWVVSPKKPETRVRRLAVLIACSARGELIPPLRTTKRR